MIKVRLAGRCFATGDDPGNSITALIASGEAQPVRISSLPMA